jgi:rhamnulokinase
MAARLSGQTVEVVHVVGGGAKNELLCQLTADACGLPVLAAPTEAAALGNRSVQARALGAPLEDLAGIRHLIRRTLTLRRYDPQTDASDLAEAEHRLDEVAPR